MLDGMSDSIQGSRIENLQSTEVDRQSPTGLILIFNYGRIRQHTKMFYMSFNSVYWALSNDPSLCPAAPSSTKVTKCSFGTPPPLRH